MLAFMILASGESDGFGRTVFIAAVSVVRLVMA